jgi:hypothetical protein
MTSGQAKPVSEPTIVPGGGTCRVLFAYDIAQAVDLAAAEEIVSRLRNVGRGREEIRVTRRAPAALGYQSRPIKLTLPCEQATIAGFRVDGQCEVLVFDFGALSVSFRIPLAGRLDALVTLGGALYENREMLALAKATVERTMELLGAGEFKPTRPKEPITAGAMTRPRLDLAVEDYVVYQIRGLRDVPTTNARDAVTSNAGTLAAILRAEAGVMSGEEINEALACMASYTPTDAVVVDWNAAMILDMGETGAVPEGDGEDVLAVLEYANVELLEMRALDDRLDRYVDEAYLRVLRHSTLGAGGLGGFAGVGVKALKQVARLQMDSAVLFEGVNNAIKLIGDQYLARVYRLAAKRFHLAERDEAIERKLRTLESLYDKMANEAAARRMEILEWIVIILIAVSIVIPFMVSGSK